MLGSVKAPVEGEAREVQETPLLERFVDSPPGSARSPSGIVVVSLAQPPMGRDIHSNGDTNVLWCHRSQFVEPSMSDNIFADDFKTTPYWWDAARPNDDYSVELPAETEVAVVGSGYSGLSAALELSRAGTHVTVLEQNELGWGASSRNGGMLSTEPKFAAPEDLTRRFGAERAERMLEDGRATFDNLKEIVDREGIECHLQQHGRFVGAHSPAAYRTLESTPGRDHMPARKV